MEIPPSLVFELLGRKEVELHVLRNQAVAIANRAASAEARLNEEPRMCDPEGCDGCDCHSEDDKQPADPDA